MIRTLWVFVVGIWYTAIYGSQMILATTFRFKRAQCICDQRPRQWAQKILRAARCPVRLVGVEGVDPDAPQIETARCTTCNECTEINGKLFAYDENMQAHIADPDAGSYRQIVEAAESCQVSIIHPGKPRNPDEPDLEELLARAAPFN